MKEFDDICSWIRAFHEQHPASYEGDDLATTYASAASVLLVVCRLNTTSGALIAGVTGLPNGFVDLIVQRLDRSRHRDAEAFRELEQAVRAREWDFSTIEEAREYAIDRFWDKALSASDLAKLMDERGCRIFGGGYQHWVDDDEVCTFLQGLEQEVFGMD
jgi:hypothetical protein